MKVLLGRVRKLLFRFRAFLSYLHKASNESGRLAPYYGDFLSAGRTPTGGAVKFFRLAEHLPETPNKFNLAYVGSNTLPSHWKEFLWILRQRNVPLVYNQNGVYYPGWYGPGWGRKNGPLRMVLHQADYVFYQSEFCKQSSDIYLGRREGPSEVLYNAVDTNVFRPVASVDAGRPLNLLLAGTQYQDYPVVNALCTLSEVNRLGLDARLQIAGSLTWAVSEEESLRELAAWCSTYGVTGKVEVLGSYSQGEVTSVHSSADILLQAKYNDPCPSGLIEALACGVPVVYSKSGGSPELVGTDAGIGVDIEHQWEKMLAPDPTAMASAVVKVADNLEGYSQAARAREVSRFDIKDWVRRHIEVFEALLKS